MGTYMLSEIAQQLDSLNSVMDTSKHMPSEIGSQLDSQNYAKGTHIISEIGLQRDS